MRIDLTDLERTRGIAEALGRLFWCLVVVAFLAAILGSTGSALLVMVLGGTAFVVRVGLEDFTRTQRRRAERVEVAPFSLRRSSVSAKDGRGRSVAGRRRGVAPTVPPS